MNVFTYIHRSSARLFAFLAVFSLLTGMVPTQAFAADVFTDSFEQPTNLGNWVAGNAWSSANAGHISPKSATVNGGNSGQIMSKAISTVGFNALTVSYWYKAYNLESASTGHNPSPADKVEVEYTLNGTTWVQFDEINDADDPESSENDMPWLQTSFSLPSGADNNANFALRFRGTLGSGNDKVYVDDVTISGTPIPPPPVDVCPNDEGVQTSLDQCTPDPVACTAPYTGFEPNCVPPPCPAGTTGVYPACVPNPVPCDAPYTGFVPACVPPPCPEGTTGTYPVCIPVPPPSCTDGIQNQDETGVDVGGVCTPPPVPCDAPYTGNQPNCVPPPCDQGQTGTYPNCVTPQPPSCTDGIQNQDETGVDVGGVCTVPPVDVCPDMDGVQTSTTECPAPVDVCPNDEGVQTSLDQCTVPPVDVCPDMDGVQTSTTECPAPVEACELTVVSDITNTVDGNSAALTWVHPAWMQEISGSVADWIWGTEFVVAPAATTTQTFTKTFTWNGPVTAATLTVAADNSYIVKVNGVQFDAGDGFAAADVYDMTAFLQTNIVSGTNTLEIVATNWSWSTENPKENPAGLIYDLNIVGNTSDDCKVVPDDGGGDDEEDKLSCELTASDTSFRRGGDATLTWNILNLMTEGVDAVLTNSVDDEEVDIATETGSREEENIGQDTTYTLTVYGDYLENSESEERESVTCSVSIDTTTGGGGGRRAPRGDVAGDSTSKPEGKVLGEQVSVVPLGAADAGAGSTSPMAIPSFGFAAAAFIGRSRK